MRDESVNRWLRARFGIDATRCFVPECFWTMSLEEQYRLADTLLRD